MKKPRVIIMPILLAIFVLSFSLTIFAGEYGQDVLITVKETYTEKYSYSVDILFRNTTYTYKMLSLAENTETGEHYVNSGIWLEETGAQTEGFRISVLNRSDVPIHTDTEFDVEDISQCGSVVTYRSEGENTLPAVLIQDDGGNKAFEYSEVAVFGLYPELDRYEGKKNVYATVYITAASGMRSNGEPFDPSRK